MKAPPGRPRPIRVKHGIFPRMVEILRLMMTSIGLVATVVCISVYVTDASTTPDQEVRLVGGNYEWEGQVEVKHNGKWGTICNDNFTKQDAQEICAKLGYSNGSKKAYPKAKFIEGSGSIMLYNGNCTGNESDISECRSRGWKSHNCRRGKNAGVSCGFEEQYVNDTKRIINSPLFPNNYPEKIIKKIKINAKKQFVKLTLHYISLAVGVNADDTEKDYLAITIGHKNTIQITSDNQDMYRHTTLISTIHNVSITFATSFRSKTIGKRYMFQFEYEAVEYPGCGVDGSINVVCTAETAFIASRFYPSLFPKFPHDVLRITGKTGQYIKLHFIDMDLTVHDHVDVLDVNVHTGKQHLLWRYDKDTRALRDVESSWHKMEIKSQSGGKFIGKGFHGRYEIIDVLPFVKDFSTCGCPSGQFHFQQTCYSVEMVEGFISQHNAEKSCQSYGGHLVSIGSEQEMKFIFTLYAEKTPKEVFRGTVLIGLLKSNNNSCYQWTDGTPLTYTAWFAGSSLHTLQPDGGYDEKCTALVFTNGRSLNNWHDVPCNNYTGVYICEKRSVNPAKAPQNLPIDEERLFRCDANEIVSKQTVLNCSDNFDEMNCAADTCNDFQFRCDDGNCIPWAYYCDHVRQCKDGSDERDCSWPKCSTSEWKCNNSQCIPKLKRCDLAKHCFDGSDEANCEFCSTKQCLKETKDDKQSCEDWWISGARFNGTFNITIGSVAIQVLCIFRKSSSFVGITTSFGESTLIPYEMATSVKNESTLRNNCSITIEITCYNKTIDDNDGNYDVIHNICKYRYCKCLEMNWDDLNKGLQHTDSITVYDSAILSKLKTNLSTNNVVSDVNSFVYITLSPLLCTTEMPIWSHQRDMYKFDNTTSTVERCIFNSESTQCTDMSYLQNCDEFDCPFGYFKCPQSFCLSSEFVCDGTNHCPNGNDEVHCETRRCPDLFRCCESQICLRKEKVCDGIMDCPMVDDEVGCNTECPEGCRCNGSVTVCKSTNIPDLFNTLNNNVRKLDISYSRFKKNEFAVPDMPYVGELICHDSDIENLTSFSFVSLINLLVLDLSYNRIKIITNRTFHSLTKLRHLSLAGNLLKVLEDFSFVGLKSLQYLNVSSNQIHTLENKAFDGLGSLIRINLMHNVVQMFSVEIFSPLRQLKELLSDLFYLCCPVIKPQTVTEDNCHPQQDEFSSCEDLIRNNTLRTSIWIVGILSFFGNFGVIIYRLNRQRHEPFKAHGLYVLNLSISDMLMGIYLLLIAAADVYYKGDYVSNDITWRESHYCKLAGVLSTMSSEASVTFILFLTVDCFLKVRYPFKIKYHITIRRAIVSSIVSWLIVAVLAIFPNFYKSYFADLFYSQTSVCLALPFSKKKTEGWEYSVALFVVYNSVAFLVMAFMQIGIYNAGKSSNRVMKTNSKQDFVLARRITLILVTDFLCWVPIGILGIISLQGHIFPPDVYAWVAVFVLPINSALNPFLYTFSEVLNQKLNKLKEKTNVVVYKYSMRNRRKNYQKFNMTIVSSVHLKRQKLSLKIGSLSDVLKWKKLKPQEAYTLMFNIVQRVADLHQNGYTMIESIKPEAVIVYLDNKTVVRAEINSRIKKLVYISDREKSIEDIGLLAISILRRLQQQ